VALAGVLVQEPHILILDEPTVGLDGPGKQEILREIGQLRHSGKTLVIVSHAIEDFLDFVDRLIVLEEGRVFTTGPPSQVFPSLLQVGKFPFLVPSVFRLCHDLRAEGWDIPEPTFRVEEALYLLDRHLGRSPAGGRKIPVGEHLN
ncbi:MAG: energy-coupling factor transporter ATPase, partial [Deltaproteobacteria bacterium]|nr:energy-coupling factor transporter ATPase [Deltaproteobacteria bacterium]